MPDSFDALIIGAGIVGAACAAELAGAGLSVGVLERDVTGGGATAAGMGHIVVLDDSPAQCLLTRYSQILWDALVRERPEPHEYHRCGTLWIAADAAEMEEVERKRDLFHSHDIQCEIVRDDRLHNLEPNLCANLAGALLVPGDSVVYAPRSAATLLATAMYKGARLVRGVAKHLVPGGVQLAGGSVLAARAVIVANGFGAVDLLPDLPIRAKKGHLAITDRYPGYIAHQLVEVGYGASAHAANGDSVAFNVQPRGTGQVLIGSSRQYDVQSRDVDHLILSSMLKRAREYLPSLSALSCIRVWTGLRSATADGLPLIGPHPGRPGVWIAAGHEGLGITTAPATAALLAAQLLGRPPAIPLEPYLPERVLRQAARV